MIDMKSDTTELKIAGRTIRAVRAAIPASFASALNRVGQHVKTEAAKKVRSIYRVRAKDVSDRVVFRRGSAKSLSAELRWKGGNIPIIKFRTNPNKQKDRYAAPPKVLKAAVKRRGMKPIRGAFVTKVGKGGHVGVFKRVGKRRLPIEEVYGPAVPVMVNEPGVLDYLESVAKKKMDERLDHEIKRRLAKAGVDST